MFHDSLLRLETIAKDALDDGESAEDYVENGLIHCGICGTKKQFRAILPENVRVFFGGATEHIFPSACKCQREKIAEDERQDEKNAIYRMQNASLMDSRLYDASFEKCDIDVNNKKVLHICKNYAETFEIMEKGNQGLLLYGPPGTGKTYAAACISNELIAKGIFVMMTSFVQLLRLAYKGDEEWFRTIANIKKARLLIIDDLGAERNTDTALEHAYGIVDDRYRSNKPVIFTTNIGLDSMRETADMRLARIYDRVLETCYPVQFIGASWRQNEAAKRFEAMQKIIEGTL